MACWRSASFRRKVRMECSCCRRGTRPVDDQELSNKLLKTGNAGGMEIVGRTNSQLTLEVCKAAPKERRRRHDLQFRRSYEFQVFMVPCGAGAGRYLRDDRDPGSSAKLSFGASQSRRAPHG